jgi:cytochrome b561
MSSDHERYTRVAILLHWIMAALIFSLFGLGWYMEDLPKGPEKGWYVALHKSIGITVFILAAVRWRWRRTHPAPPLPLSVAPWQRRLAALTHKTFYMLFLLQPLTGYLSSSFSGHPTSFFWLVPLPQWGWKEPVANEFFTGLHEAGSMALLALVLLHVTGALFHAVSPGDRILRRMLP